MAAASETSLVVVTGASGYIATHVIQQLQEAGYRVRGTVRSLQDETKVKHLNELCPNAQFKLEVVEADLTKPESWEPAIKGATYVIHVASPFPNTTPKDENEVIQPAVEGTQSVLKACVSAKTVKRVVVTSSCAAISWGPQAAQPDKVYSEEDWSDVEKLDAYAKSKTLAEKAAWDFIKELPDEDKIELAVVNPAYVMGPVLHGSQCTSMEVVKRLMERSMPAVPKLNFPIVDVRDVAAAHIKAMLTPEAAGQRHLIVNSNYWMKEMAQMLTKEFKPQGYNIPTMNCPYFALWMTSLFDRTIKMILPQIGKVHKFDNTKMKDILGITPREAKDTLVDMAYSLIEGGFVKKTKKYRGPGGEPAEEAKAEEDQKEGEQKADGEEIEKPKENGDVNDEKPTDETKMEEGGKEEKEEKKEAEKEEKAEEKKEVNQEEQKEDKAAETKAEEK